MRETILFYSYNLIFVAIRMFPAKCFIYFLIKLHFLRRKCLLSKKLSLNSSNTQRKTLGYKLAKPNFLYM